MLNDARILEIYIDSMIQLICEAEFLAKQETDLLHKTNLFNRKNNLEAIRHEYKKFNDTIDKEWSQIYSNSKEFLERKNEELEFPFYTATLTQKLVDRFFFRLSKLTEMCIDANNPERKGKRVDSIFFNDSFFGSLRAAIGNIFPVVVISIINHSISIGENKKKAFLEINKKYIRIPYRAGDSLTDIGLNQMLLNMQKEKDEAEERFLEEIRKEEDCKVEPILYPDELEEEVELLLENYVKQQLIPVITNIALEEKSVNSFAVKKDNANKLGADILLPEQVVDKSLVQEIDTLCQPLINMHALSHSLREEETISKTPVKDTGFAGKVPEASVEDMRKYGKLMLLLLDPDTREAGYASMEKMENSFPEAGISLGQYYNGTDPNKAKTHFKVAADAGIAEGQWGYSQLLPHSYILDFADAKDKEYLKYCLEAAEGGCPDAANEIGNICHRKGFYAESTYWYGMAYSLEHPQGMTGLRGITKEWAQQGITQEYTPHLEKFIAGKHKTSLLLYKMFNQSLNVQDMDDLMMLAIAGENLAGFILAKLMEQHNHDDTAYTVYNVLTSEKHPYALRCYADMLIAGKGTTKDVNKALQMYELAAKGGNNVAMFVMGQKAEKEGDKYLAACWYGQAYSRGMEMAGERLKGLAANA